MGAHCRTVQVHERALQAISDIMQHKNQHLTSAAGGDCPRLFTIIPPLAPGMIVLHNFIFVLLGALLTIFGLLQLVNVCVDILQVRRCCCCC